MSDDEKCNYECVDSQFGMCGECQDRLTDELSTLRDRLAAAEAERDALRDKARMFPVLDEARYSVPWNLVVPYEAQAQRNHEQSLEKLASRGGLSSVELIAVIEGRGLYWVMDNAKMPEAQARARVRELLQLDAHVQLAAERAARVQAEAALSRARELLELASKSLWLYLGGHTPSEIETGLLGPDNGSPFAMAIRARRDIDAYLADPANTPPKDPT